MKIGKETRAQGARRSQEIQDATAELEPAIESGLNNLWRLVAAELGTAAVLSALARGDASDAMQALAIAELRSKFVDVMRDAYQSAFENAGKVLTTQPLPLVPSSVSHRFEYEALNWRIVRMAEQRTAGLVTQVSDQTRRALRRVIASAIDDGLGPRVAAQEIRPLVGLTDRHAAAVQRFHTGLVDGGMKRSRATEKAARYASRLLRYRTENIARTEMLWTANAAQLEQWRQMRDVGLLTGAEVMVWSVTDDERLCDLCAPMDGLVTESIDVPFVSELRGFPGQEPVQRPQPQTLEHPPLHPMCRCGVVLQDASTVQTIDSAGNELMAAAREAEPDVTPFLQDTARANGGKMEGLGFKFKDKESMTRKLTTIRAENGVKSSVPFAKSQINDALRYTMVVDDSKYSTAVASVFSGAEGRGWQLLDSKKYWVAGGNYRGINSVFRLPNGTKVELQFHTPQSFDVKESILHPLYERFRVLDRTAREALELSRQMTDAANSIPFPSGLDLIPGRLVKSLWL